MVCVDGHAYAYVHMHAQKPTQIHTRTCIVAHIPLQAGPAHKGHHVALYSLWHEAPTLPALHCPLPAGEHAPKTTVPLFLCLYPSLSLSFIAFPLVYRTWTEMDVVCLLLVSKVHRNLRWMGVCLWRNTVGKSCSCASLSAFVSRQISNLCPTEVENIVVERWSKWLIVWMSVKLTPQISNQQPL